MKVLNILITASENDLQAISSITQLIEACTSADFVNPQIHFDTVITPPPPAEIEKDKKSKDAKSKSQKEQQAIKSPSTQEFHGLQVNLYYNYPSTDTELIYLINDNSTTTIDACVKLLTSESNQLIR
jgi:hypothetical protein